MNLFTKAALAALVGVAPLSVHAEETLKIAFIDPLSGPFGPSGDAALRHWQYAADEVNKGDGINGQKVEIVAYDNKINPKESLVQLQKALDQGIRYIAQGNGSSVASALIDAIEKHNKRNPGEEVLFLNYAAVDPAFTNERCSFWHFRFDSDADMKMNAVTDWLVGQPDIKKVYIIGQDYSFGKAVAHAATTMIAAKRPDIEIVGNELHPLGKVKDFTPYVQKMISAEADAVITGNWGADMVLLVKAATSSGHKVPYLTYYAGSLGAATIMGEGAVGQVKQISEMNTNLETPDEQDMLIDGFETKNSDISYYYHRIFTAMGMFDAAATAAGSVEPIKVAMALEGMEYDTAYGPVTMRADNHQILQPLYMSTFSADVKRDVEDLGLGWASGDGDRIEADKTSMPTSCEMKRP
ncbi:branched-chain amino acid ABC transporter substrate-binding protein [Shimia biformata]|uniref:branched-chain amino acid ABC transporter substrate-binding protein n=1 Tax=Shimia biformata TaxID=1294299 RepID=UPI00194F7705|nr:branched-chain amino acid ABC transporter substrate-binding protein [Shimia biformata]